MQEIPSSLFACQYSIYLRSRLNCTSSRNLALLQTDGSYLFLLNILIIVSAHFLSFSFLWPQSESKVITLLTKVHLVKAMVFPVAMYGCDSWTIKKAKCWRIDAFELCWRRLLRVPWTARSNQINPKGNQLWIFTGKTDAEAPILWSPDAKSWLIGKDSDAGKDWRPKKKRAAEDEMVGCHHWFNGYEFEQTPGDSEGQGSLECYNPHHCKVGHNLVTEKQHVGT